MNTQNDDPKQFISAKVLESCNEKGIVVESLDDNFDLFESGAFDSLGFVSLVSSIEQNYGIELDFSEHDPEAFSTLRGLADVVAASR